MKIMREGKGYSVVGLGEVMLRFSPDGTERISQSRRFTVHPGGSELNVVSGISQLGLKTGIITRLPGSSVARMIRNQIRSCGVSDELLIADRSPRARVGTYYYEYGASPRKPAVTYDRNDSSFTGISASEVEPGIFRSAAVFHTSGITLALGKEVREEAVEILKRFREGGAAVSFDINYRANLWDEKTAREAICSILPYVDILFVSEETSRRMMARTGSLEEIMRGYCEQFGISLVASTQRTAISPKCHSFNSLLYSHGEGKYYTGLPYENIDVVDRIGSGDAYVAGVLFGCIKFGDCSAAVEYGNAMAALKNTVAGDMTDTDFDEITRMVDQHRSGLSSGEMDR